MSLTIRQRLMPAMTCSALTRTLEITWLNRLDKDESSPPRGFFSGWISALFWRTKPFMWSTWLCGAEPENR